MENTDLIKQYIASLDGAVAALTPDIKELISKSFEDRLNATSDPQEQLTISNGYAYILVSLCFAYLKSQGVNTATHPIMKDLERVKSYMNRAKSIAEGKGDKEVQVDTTAAKRFINSVLGNQPAISQENFKPKHIKFDDNGVGKTQTQKEERESPQVSESDVAESIKNRLKEKLKAKEKKSGNKDKVSKKK